MLTITNTAKTRKRSKLEKSCFFYNEVETVIALMAYFQIECPAVQLKIVRTFGQIFQVFRKLGLIAIFCNVDSKVIPRNLDAISGNIGVLTHERIHVPLPGVLQTLLSSAISNAKNKPS